MELNFLVQGSESDPYRVVFRRIEDNFTATCTCKGAEMGQVCKHRVNLLKGDITGLVSGNSDQLNHLPEMFAGTDVERAYEKLIEAEATVEAAKLEFSRCKKALARAMHD
jgi:uncharacterized Zn finger protein